MLPVGTRLISAGTSRGERVGLVAMLGIGLYVVKVCYSPTRFIFYDELLHVRTTNDLLIHDRLFGTNPLLPVSPLYPGLEVVTSALVRVTGVPMDVAGLLVIGAARLVLVLSLFFLFERATDSARVAGIAVLIYTANPNFVYWGAQYAYESLALSLAVFAVAAVASRTRSNLRLGGLALAALGSIGAVVTTHHITSYALAAFLVLWTLVELCSALGARHGGWKRDERSPAIYALFAIIASICWLFFVASPVVDYLTRPVMSAARQVIGLIAGEEQNRQLFHSFGGQMNPLWEQVAAFAGVTLILVGLPFGLARIWRAHRHQALLVTFAIAALAYPVSLGLRFTQLGLEVSERSSDFVFIALAPVLALVIAEVWPAKRAGWFRAMVGACLVAVVFVGAQVQGWADWARLPGPYRVGADMRSIDSESIEAAQWARIHLGPNTRIAADRTNAVLMSSDGEQYPVTLIYDTVNVAQAILSPQWGKNEQATIQRGKIAYLVIDRRITHDLPLVGVYFEPGEPDAFRHTRPVDPAVLAKFDGIGNISRIFDSGNIVVYDVQDISSAP
jgi:hypothetical protein